ncbi:hypothetical protein BDV28DRAFT_126435 [Aspergillus coremiiformis]|uniref:Uncharacterized protein n=1 Tax=Aspergillus coremiiformis TaxID=138285 RepID=A0A5N6ZIV9_9EURO|nr:hypothetical protein BDV28DRAFT_126435 [Aspergillus coremiiformis]
MAVINQKATPLVPPSHRAPVQQPVDPAFYPAVYQRFHPGLYHPSAYPAVYPLAHPAAYPVSHPASHSTVHPTNHPGTHHAGHPVNHHTGHPGGFQGGQQEGHPGVPRTVHTAAPRSIDSAKRAEAMARLNVNAERQASGNRQRGPDSIPQRETDSRSPLFYIGYTFFKKDAIPGHKSTWNHAEKTQMNLTQSELLNMVHRRTRKLPSIQQYQSLSKAKRSHVDQFINELKEKEPHFEWTCAYVKEEERLIKGKNNKHGDYETISMDVVAMGKPVTAPRPKVPGMPKERVESKPDSPVVINEPRAMEKDIEHTAEWTRPYPGHTQQQPMVQNVQRQLNPESPQQVPPPPPPPPQAHPTRGRPLVNQAHLPQGAPAAVHFDARPQPSMPHAGKPAPEKSPAIKVLRDHVRPLVNQTHLRQGAPAVVPFAVHPQPDMPHATRVAPEKGPATEILKENARGVPVSAGVNHPGQGIQHHHNPAGMPVNNNIPRKEPPHCHDGRYHENVPQGGSVKPPNLAAEPEPEWPPDSSSIGDNDSQIFDFEEDSSFTDDSEDDGEARKDSQPWRGSLFRRHSSGSRHPGPSRYRAHYRKQPSENKEDRTKYTKEYVDVVPADSRDSNKQLWGLRNREIAQQTRDRPKIIHAPVSPDDLDMTEFGERYHGLRARNDIRSRILDDREARLERRERRLDYRTRILDEKLDEAWRRSMSLREPGPYYSQHYYENY